MISKTDTSILIRAILFLNANKSNSNKKINNTEKLLQVPIIRIKLALRIILKYHF